MRVPFRPEAVWELLMHQCGAPEHQRDAFLFHIKRGGQEFRFGGKLGMGGKFYNTSDGRVYVTCYSEDLTAERTHIIEKANAGLKKLITIKEPI